MQDQYQNDISYPYYLQVKENGKMIFDKLISKLSIHGGVNLTAQCMSCHRDCFSSVMYCTGCRELLKNHLDNSRSICN